MTRISVAALWLGLAALACMPFGSISNAEAIQWVTVGDPGNAADTNPAGYGAVSTAFQIMKYEFTNQQYADFLNSVAHTDTYSLYNANMGSNARGGITQSGTSGSYTYAVKTNMSDKPVNYVSWFDAARVANWLMNGATSSSSTETGAYTLVGGQISGTAPAVNDGASFYIPTENQWYKAAFYKGGNTNAGYWDYPTQSDADPNPVTSGTTGIGPGNSGNSANYSRAAIWNDTVGNVTSVGTNGGPSAYGAFDMGGNVIEWNDLNGTADSLRGLRGGDWNASSSVSLSSSSRFANDPSYDYGGVFGFRLASPTPVPEIDPNSLGSVLALVLGSLGLLERRRLKAA